MAQRTADASNAQQPIRFVNESSAIDIDFTPLEEKLVHELARFVRVHGNTIQKVEIERGVKKKLDVDKVLAKLERFGLMRTVDPGRTYAIEWKLVAVSDGKRILPSLIIGKTFVSGLGASRGRYR